MTREDVKLRHQDGADIGECKEAGSAYFQGASGKTPPGSTFDLTSIGLAEDHKSGGPVDSGSFSDFTVDSDKFISEIMMSLDSEKLEALRRAFEQNDDEGLSLAEFVHVMTSIMGKEISMREDVFAANLIEFFDQVDINGDGSMEWEEFTSFIVEMGE